MVLLVATGMKVAVISGASSGIGAALAHQLAHEGWQVLAGYYRTPPQDWPIPPVAELMVPVALDVTDPESIVLACSTMQPWLEQATQVVLVNNAGLVVPGPLERLSMAQLREQFEVNLFGQLALTQALLPWLRRAEQARVIMVSSIAGQVAFPMMGAYCASKHALEALSASLRMELTPWRISVIVVAPGSVKTPLWQKTFARLDSATHGADTELEMAYEKAFPNARQAAGLSAARGLDVQGLVRVVVRAMTKRNPKPRYVVARQGWLYGLLRGLPTGWRDALILSRYRAKP